MAEESFVMFGALWFKPDGGAQLYDQYVAAARPYADRYGLGANREFVPVETVHGDFTPDLVFFNEHPDERAFEELRSDPGYRSVLQLREEAIEREHVVKLRRR